MIFLSEIFYIFSSKIKNLKEKNYYQRTLPPANLKTMTTQKTYARYVYQILKMVVLYMGTAVIIMVATYAVKPFLNKAVNVLFVTEL